MKFVKTDDGSFTGWNEEFEEHYHSTTGALEEAREKYFIPLKVTDGLTILDFCFGLGYNSAVAMNNCSNLDIIALEKDPEIIESIAALEVPVDYRKVFDVLAVLGDHQKIEDSRGNRLELILADALLAITHLQDEYFDIVFFDPFSPSKQPEMWSDKLFEDIYRIMKKGGKLATYSCAGRVRRNLKKVGFLVKDGPKIGRRSPSTIAIK